MPVLMVKAKTEEYSTWPRSCSCTLCPSVICRIDIQIRSDNGAADLDYPGFIHSLEWQKSSDAARKEDSPMYAWLPRACISLSQLDLIEKHHSVVCIPFL